MKKTNWIKPLVRSEHNYKHLEGMFRYKKQTYLVRVNADIAWRGFLRGKGTVTNIWRVSNNPSENNENGVIPGVRSQQGPYNETALKRLINKVNWG